MGIYDEDKDGRSGDAIAGEETKLLDDGVHVLDFDMLCASVALQTQGFSVDKRVMSGYGCEDDLHLEIGAVQRMWEGGILDCLQDRRIALESSCFPCYRFGKNMDRANLGSCFFQGSVYSLFVLGILFSAVAFGFTLWHGFLYIGASFVASAAIYLGYCRGRIRKQFNIRVWFEEDQVRDSALTDCMSHLVCPCCTLCQESRTLEMNNVQNGTWHGRSDTICIGSSSNNGEAMPRLLQPSVVPRMSPEPCNMERFSDNSSSLTATLHPSSLVPTL